MHLDLTRPDGLFCFNDPLAMGAMNTRWITEYEFRRIWRSLAAEISTTMIHFVFHSPASINTAGESEKKLRASRSAF